MARVLFIIVILLCCEGDLSLGASQLRGIRSEVLLSDFHYKQASFSSRNSSLAFWERQEGCVDGYAPCSDIFCCPDGDSCCDGGETCCASSKPVCQSGGCCATGKTACGGDSPYCHDSGTICCTDFLCLEDQSCCGEDWCCFPGASCCADGNACCYPDEVCCSEWCCPQGSSCSDEYFECIDNTGEEPGSEPSGGAASSSPTPNPPQSSTSPTTAPTPTLPKVTLPSSSTTSSTSSLPPLDESASPTEASPTFTSHSPTAASSSAPSSLPTLIFTWAEQSTDDLVENMCLGLRNQGAPAQSQVLTYSGNSTAQRQQTRCKNGRCCSGQKKASGPNAGWPLSCDEYPFASTAEGGKSTTQVGCIVAFQNGAQGDYLRDFYRDYDMKPGDQFEVQITGIDCDTVKENQIPGCNNFGKRDPQSASVGVFYSVAPTSSDNNFLVIAMGDMDPGPYHVQVSFSNDATLDDISILDNQGYVYDTVTSIEATDVETSSTLYTLSFNLPNATYGVSIIGTTYGGNFSAQQWNVSTGLATTSQGAATSTALHAGSTAGSGNEPNAATKLGGTAVYGFLVGSVAVGMMVALH